MDIKVFFCKMTYNKIYDSHTQSLFEITNNALFISFNRKNLRFG